MSPITVTGLALAPVKAMRLRQVQEVELDELGAVGDRRFYVVDERGRMVNGKQFAALQTIVADYDAGTRELTLTFPDGAVVSGRAEHGEPVTARFYHRTDEVPELRGPWSEAVSAHVGQPLRVVAARTGVDRGHDGATSLISRASLQRLAEAAGRASIDARRFRMLIEVDGVGAHEEDGWVGRRLRVGEALVRMRGHVGRCLITSRDPDSARADLPTLDLLRSYRGGEDATEPLPFGVYGEVLEAGRVCVGDPVALDGRV
jgi:MOSC domain-containing protein